MVSQHNEREPIFGTGMGDYFEGFLDEQMRGLEMTVQAVRSWHPPKAARRRSWRSNP